MNERRRHGTTTPDHHDNGSGSGSGGDGAENNNNNSVPRGCNSIITTIGSIGSSALPRNPQQQQQQGGKSQQVQSQRRAAQTKQRQISSAPLHPWHVPYLLWIWILQLIESAFSFLTGTSIAERSDGGGDGTGKTLGGIIRNRVGRGGSARGSGGIPELELVADDGGGASKPRAAERSVRTDDGCGTDADSRPLDRRDVVYDTDIEPAFLNPEEYPPGWLTYDPVSGRVVKRVEALLS